MAEQPVPHEALAAFLLGMLRKREANLVTGWTVPQTEREAVRWGLKCLLDHNRGFVFGGKPLSELQIPRKIFQQLPEGREALVREAVKNLQLAAASAPSFETLPALFHARLSAFRVARMSPSQFERTFGGVLGPDGSNLVRQHALRVSARNDRALTELLQRVQGTGVLAVDGPGSLQQRLDRVRSALDKYVTTPNIARLLGDAVLSGGQDGGLGITSPAAYFVSLLGLLRNSGPGLLRDWSGREGMPTLRGSALAGFLRRRPDLGRLELTSGNAIIALPVIDLVNELLVSLVSYEEENARHAITGKLCIEGHNAGSGGEPPTEPQHVNARVYETLARDIVAADGKLPYNQPLDAVRLLLAALGTSRAEIMRVFRRQYIPPSVTRPDAWSDTACPCFLEGPRPPSDHWDRNANDDRVLDNSDDENSHDESTKPVHFEPHKGEPNIRELGDMLAKVQATLNKLGGGSTASFGDVDNEMAGDDHDWRRIRNTARVIPAAGRATLSELHSEALRRAGTAEELALSHEEYVILTEQAFWSKEHFDVLHGDVVTADAYQRGIGVRQPREFWTGSGAGNVRLDVQQAQLPRSAAEVLARAGIGIADLAEMLRTRFVNPNRPPGRFGALVERLQPRYRLLAGLRDTRESKQHAALKPLLKFLRIGSGYQDAFGAGSGAAVSRALGEEWIRRYFEPAASMIVLSADRVATKAVKAGDIVAHFPLPAGKNDSEPKPVQGNANQWDYVKGDEATDLTPRSRNQDTPQTTGEGKDQDPDHDKGKDENGFEPPVFDRTNEMRESDELWGHVHANGSITKSLEDLRIVGYVSLDGVVYDRSGVHLSRSRPWGEKRLVFLPEGSREGDEPIEKIPVSRLGYVSAETSKLDIEGYEPPASWKTAGAGNDLTKVRLRHLDGSRLTSGNFDRLHRFIRLWRKTGWTIVELDAAIVALGPDNDDGDMGYNNFRTPCGCRPLVAACSNASSPRHACHGWPVATDITSGLIDRLAIVDRLVRRTGLGVLMILALWAPIDASLYAELFPADSFPAADAGPGPDVTDHFLAQGPKILISEHRAVLQAALHLDPGGLDAIMALAVPQTDDLTLTNLSAIYRHSLLASSLKVRPEDLGLILRVIGTPWESPGKTMELFEQWDKMLASGLNIKEFAFVFNDIGDAALSLGPSEATIQELHDFLKGRLGNDDSRKVEGGEGLTQAIVSNLASLASLPLSTTAILLRDVLVLDKNAPIGTGALATLELEATASPSSVDASLLKTLTALKKLALLIDRFKLSTDEILYLQTHGEDFGGLDWNKLRFAHWEQLHTYGEVRKGLPGLPPTSLLALFTWARSPEARPADLPGRIAAATLWGAEDVARLLSPQAFDLGSPSLFRNAIALRRLQKALGLVAATGASMTTLFRCADPSPSPSAAASVAAELRTTLRGRAVQNSCAGAALKRVTDALRVHQRDALVAYLRTRSWLLCRGVGDAASLSALLLVDVQTGPARMTTRLGAAIEAVKMFVQQGLRAGDEKAADTDGEPQLPTEPDDAPDIIQYWPEVLKDLGEPVDGAQWEVLADEDAWVARRLASLGLGLGPDGLVAGPKSPQFEALEAELRGLGAGISEKAVVEAAKRYLYAAAEVANLQPLAIFVEDDAGPAAVDGKNAWELLGGIRRVHFFARTHTTPGRIYHRTFDGTAATWGPWRRVPIDVPEYTTEVGTKVTSGCYLVPFVYRGRLILGLPQLSRVTAEVQLSKVTAETAPTTTASDQPTAVGEDPGNDQRQAGGKQPAEPAGGWDITFAYAEMVDGRWLPTVVPAEIMRDIAAEALPSSVSAYRFIPSPARSVTGGAEFLNIEVHRGMQAVGSFSFDGATVSVAASPPPSRSISPSVFQSFLTQDASITVFPLHTRGGRLDFSTPVVVCRAAADAGGHRTDIFLSPSIQHGFDDSFLPSLVSAVSDAETCQSFFSNLQDLPESFRGDVWGARLLPPPPDGEQPPPRAYGPYNRPYALYAWEAVVRLPVLAAERALLADQPQLALKLVSQVFDPRAPGLWRFGPLARVAAADRTAEDWVNRLRRGGATSDPATRPGLAAVVLLYARASIAEGDRLRRLGDADGATRAYLAAEEVVGRPPEEAERAAGDRRGVESYMTLLGKSDELSSAVTELELEFPVSCLPGRGVGYGEAGGGVWGGLGAGSYFSFPQNAEALYERKRIAARLSRGTTGMSAGAQTEEKGEAL